MNIEILNEIEKKELIQKLNEQFGIKKIKEHENLVRLGRERIVLFSGDLDLLKEIEKITRIEGIGVYIAKDDNGLRLSIEGTQLFKEQINKNIFEVNETQMDKWMHGEQLDISSKNRGFVAIKYKDDFLGTGKASENKIGNFIPKERRLKISQK